MSGIEAPESVPEGSTGPIEISAPGSTEVRISVASTGEVFDVPVVAGTALFELPAGATSGSIVIVTDRHDPTNAAAINVVPATN